MTKAKVKTLAEAKKAAGIESMVGGDDLETVKVSGLFEAGVDFIVYAAQKMDSQFEEGSVYLVQIGDDKGVNSKFWTSHAALMHQLERMLEHDLLPVATKIVQRHSKTGRDYYDFEG